MHIYHIDSLVRSSSEGVPFSLPPGTGPRHLVFIPETELILLVCELISLAFLLKWDPERGVLLTLCSIPVIDIKSGGAAQPGGVKVHPSGKTAAVSCRGTNTIAIVSLPEGGNELHAGKESGGKGLSLLKVIDCGGINPRDIEFSSTGRWLLTANQDSSEIALTGFDPKTGLPDEECRRSFPVGTPACIIEL
ncbi:MAG: beta-propeller fold lactonase family protein [Spirochaetales bacterium]|nr:beta-propeller fold lactonase family protein [Spirochaetales bacterium]